MPYDVAIATLNRAETLRDTLLLIEAQTEAPRRIIVVDASDDHDAMLATVVPHLDTGRFDYRFVPTRVKNLPYQRNLGLDLVVSDVVMMPDDDSFLFAGTAAEIMAAYRADADGIVGAVTGKAVAHSPAQTAAHAKRTGDTIKEAIQPVRNKVEAALFPKPFNTYAQELWRERRIPAWIDGDRFALVETVGGFRMSMRSDLARRLRFDEALGYGIGYATHEDMEMSMRVQSAGYLLVGANQAPIFHNVFPSKRAGGFNYGFCQIANYIYTCRRNIPERYRAWSQLSRFMRYKIALYRIAARNDYGREVHEGASVAWEQRHTLLDAAPDALDAAYRRLCDAVIRSPGSKPAV